MEDFYYAGGLRGLMKTLADGGLLHLDALTVNGPDGGREHRRRRGLQRRCDPPAGQPDLCRRRAGRAARQPGARRRGHQAQRLRPALLQHTGPALVFDDYPALKKAVDDPDLDVTDHVLVLRNAGPQGGPGMPEWGMLPIPTKLVKQGVRDMLRLSDARMSGTSYGACVLHVSPEAYIGGPLALVRTGDLITWTCRRAASTWR
jgi:dihydroxyacid dehydratase/phosphogluconate dehydratase